ncbi:adenylate/guanylate cyclase domain-containing protein [Mycobacterium hodleri]|uniref:adenylate/guanylate cyclase domain-containing protein n=1 Tax=Mycolicibacterium hodleri TaxID=49897 RepID=UPI0021F27131|nr:adenylate/guanylate cyclase domain-containing protein [Mycolicibacterium hodleri]MCV7135741.1 adenylate/guanylate cyclase domain-containing protein [Mycolicibacterium hodleri]
MAVPVSRAPRTRYASRGDLDIAYQVIGDGPVDLVVMPGPFVPIDSIDSEPSMYRFYRRLSSFCRVIRFDHRGMGMSSRIGADKITPACWAEDAVAVMDAVGCESATIMSSGYTAMSALFLAADRPERVTGLVVVNGAARVLWAPDYEAGIHPQTANSFTAVAMESDAVERGVDVLATVAPSVAHDQAFRTWWDVAGNRGASPSMARRSSQALTDADVRDKLPAITAPTLIVHRKDARFVGVGHGRFLAERIPGARYVELPGDDTLYWVGDTTPVLAEIEEFVTGSRGGSDAERVLTTIVFTDIVGSTQRAAALGDDHWRDLLDSHDNLVRRELARFGGREVNTAGDGFVATFSSPSVALDCAEQIVGAVATLGVDVRVGIHAGEVEARGQDIAGMAVHIGARITALAGPSEVLVSSTVREIVTGSHRVFAERGEHRLRGVPGTWCVYAL